MVLRQFLRMLRFLLGLSLVLLCTDNVSAGKVSASGRVVQGGWEQDEGCITTIVSVFGSDEVARETGAGGPETTTMLSVGIQTLDFCAGVFTTVGGQGAGEFTMAGLNEAHLRATLPAQIPVKGKPPIPVGEITMDVTFVGTGDVTRNFFLNIGSIGNDFRARGQGSSRVRDATITGSVKLNGVEALNGSPGFGQLSTGAQASFDSTF
jgi:hypothetical protein